jgi:hypothetical protein
MPKMTTKIVSNGILTFNPARKRCHFLYIGDKTTSIKEAHKIVKKEVKKYRKIGYSIVPFECCCEPGDELEMIDKNGKVISQGFADVGFGATSRYAVWKKQGLSDEDCLKRGFAEVGREVNEVQPGIFSPKGFPNIIASNEDNDWKP